MPRSGASHMPPKMGKSEPLSHWKYAPFLPLPSNGKIISMQEGGTTLLPSIGRKNTFFKLEYENPTGSFKDRGSTVEISHAHADAYKKVVCASTGNMGASIAAYAARAGIQATIFVPSHVPPNKLKQIKSYGAKLIHVKGSYADALHKTWEVANKDSGIMLTGDYPLRMEGQKTIGFEIVEQVKGKRIDNVIVPIGNGTLIAALHASFVQMRHAGMLKQIPRLVGVQATNCSPLAQAWEKKSMRFSPVKNPHTMAGAIECGNPVYGLEALMAVHQTKGKILSVSESRLAQAKLSLARKEGLYSEYSGAAIQAILEDYSFPGTTVAILGGHGLKE